VRTITNYNCPHFLRKKKNIRLVFGVLCFAVKLSVKLSKLSLSLSLDLSISLSLSRSLSLSLSIMYSLSHTLTLTVLCVVYLQNLAISNSDAAILPHSVLSAASPRAFSSHQFSSIKHGASTATTVSTSSPPTLSDTACTANDYECQLLEVCTPCQADPTLPQCLDCFGLSQCASSDVACISTSTCALCEKLPEIERPPVCTDLCGGGDNPDTCEANPTLSCQVNGVCTTCLDDPTSVYCFNCLAFANCASEPTCEQTESCTICQLIADDDASKPPLCATECNDDEEPEPECDFGCELQKVCVSCIANPAQPFCGQCFALGNCGADPTCLFTNACGLCTMLDQDTRPALCGPSCPGFGLYTPTIESVQAHPLPQWYNGAKFGVFVHWGAYSVPAWGVQSDLTFGESIAINGLPYTLANNVYGAWYQNTLRIANSSTDQYHTATHAGAPYTDFADQLATDVQNFDANELADLVQESLAKYFVITTKHHEGFVMYNTTVPHPFAEGGTYRLEHDLVGDVLSAMKDRDIVPGIYYSGGFDWSFETSPIVDETSLLFNAPETPEYAAYVLAHYQEIIARYQPKILWNDVSSTTGLDRLGLWASYYNAIPDGVINDRWNVFAPPFFGTGAPGGSHADFTTVELAELEGIQAKKFEYTRPVGVTFAFNRNAAASSFLSGSDAIQTLVDTVSKNGNLLLGIGPRSDGSIRDEESSVLRAIGAWLQVNGQGVFDSSVYTVADGSVLDRSDIAVRYTTNNGALYAFVYSTSPSAVPNDIDARATITLESLKTLPNTQVSVLGDDSAAQSVEIDSTRNRIALSVSATTLSSGEPIAIKIDPAPVYEPYQVTCEDERDALQQVVVDLIATIQGLSVEKAALQQQVETQEQELIGYRTYNATHYCVDKFADGVMCIRDEQCANGNCVPVRPRAHAKRCHPADYQYPNGNDNDNDDDDDDDDDNDGRRGGRRGGRGGRGGRQ
jgi:alpha-L-fucosidase